MEASCHLGLLYAKLGAAQVIDIIEATSDHAPPLPPTHLRERWADMSYVPPNLEHAAHMVQMEEDMALRGNRDAQRR